LHDVVVIGDGALGGGGGDPDALDQRRAKIIDLARFSLAPACRHVDCSVPRRVSVTNLDDAAEEEGWA
jgi:hypothetical protein